MAETIKIGGELESTATGNVVAAASAIKDKVKNKYQGEINAETDATLANHASAIQGLNSQNYATVTATDQTTAVTDVLPATGSADTIYRVGSWDGTQYDETCYSEYSWNGSAYVHISTKIQVGEVFDISAYHATGGEIAKYADLTAALGTNGANIPDALRKGGMSVKFVHSVDNKYVQFMCIADEFTTDVTQWQGVDDEPTAGSDNLVKSGGVAEMYGTYTENPEFAYVKTDSEGKILYGVKQNGEFFFGTGCPQQIIDYIDKKIADLSLDEYEDIVAFLDNYLGSDTTLKVIIDGINTTKLDKEGLDPDALGTVQVVENPEYIQVTTDSENKILEGITSKGVKQINLPIDTPLASMESIENPEWLSVTIDSEGRVLGGRKTDGTVVENCDVEYPNGIPTGIKSYVDESINIEDEVSISYVSNNQYLITFGKYTILLFRTISIENDQDNWNIGTIKRGDNVICPTGTDIIGPIKVSGDSDFLSGVHGSSTTTILNVCCDGKQLTLDSSLNVSGSIITIQMLDECRRTTDQSHVFDRYVTITITSNRIKISNTFKCVVEGITVETATNGGLFAIQNNHYNSLSLNNCIYTTPPSLSINNTSKNNISAVFNTNNGSVTVHNIKGHELSTYRGQAVVFTNENPMRTKIYFYLMLNTAVSNGEEISGEFEYVFS